MFHVQQLLPKNYEPANPVLPPGFMEFAATLKGVDSDWVRVPDSKLSIKLAVMINGASIEIKKHGKMALIGLCCFEPEYRSGLLKVVKRLYKDNRLGEPQQPRLPCWVHMIPVKGTSLDEDELTLSGWLVITFYWVIFGQQMKRNKVERN